MHNLTQPILDQLKGFQPTSCLADIDVLAERLSVYLMLLHKWNQTYNLTAVRDVHDMIARHLIDSLAIASWVKGPRVLDVGTGPGLPGIPLALANPHLEVVLLDSNGKKTRFLQEVKRQLQLNLVEVVQSRVEDYQPNQAFDTVVTRAFSQIGEMLTCTQHVLKPSGIWLAMKGLFPADELNAVHHAYRIESYAVPGVQGERCCAVIMRDVA